MNRQTRLIILAAILFAPFASDARTVAINVRPEQTNSVCVEHVQYTPLTLEMTVLGVTSTSATFVVRNASNVVVISTNATVNGDTYTAVTTAGNWTDTTTGVMAPGDEPVQFWADLHLAGYGVPLRPIDIRVRYAANTGTEAHVDPVTGLWTIGGTNRGDITRVVVPAGSTVAGGVLTMGTGTDAITNGYHGGMSGTGSVTRVGGRLRIVMPDPGTTTNALALGGEPAAVYVRTVVVGGTNHTTTNGTVTLPAIAGPAGTNGTNGAPGGAGAAATIAVGTVTTGAVAAVTNSGTSSAAVFDFVLQPGPQGIQGPPGSGGGAWTASGYTGTPARIAGFLEGGAAGYVGFGAGLYLDGSDLIAISNAVLVAAAEFGLWLASPSLPASAITNSTWLTAVSIGAGLTGNGTPGSPLVATGGVTNHQSLSGIPGDPAGYHLSAANAARAAAALTNDQPDSVSAAMLQSGAAITNLGGGAGQSTTQYLKRSGGWGNPDTNTEYQPGAGLTLDTVTYPHVFAASNAVLSGAAAGLAYTGTVFAASGTGRLTLGVSGGSVTGAVDVSGLATGTPVYVESDPIASSNLTAHLNDLSGAHTPGAVGAQPTNAYLTAWAALNPTSKADTNDVRFTDARVPLAHTQSWASITGALARARAPQAVTYTGTNVYTDATLGGVYRINATNDFRLHKPTGATDGQSLKWWIKQHVGGTNTITMVASEFVIPVGATTPVLSVTNGCVDVLLGEWDGVNSRVRVQSFMRYRE